MMKRNTILSIELALLAAFSLCAVARAQVEPAAVGASAKLDYDFGYSQTADIYAGYDVPQERGIASGEIEYLNGHARTPLNLMYSGGYIAGISGKGSGTGFFQHLMISQGYQARSWSTTLKEELNFYPESPTTGFSGIPGVGILPGLPGQGDQPILSLNTLSLYNAVTATFMHTINYDTTFSVDGNYTSVRFPDGGGFDVNEVGVRPQVRWRLNALNSASVQYVFNRSNYLGSPFVIDTESVQPGLMHVWNRRLTTSASVGPEWTRSNNNFFIPPSTGIAANGEIVYTGRSLSASANYYRSVSAGAGLGTQIGIRNNDANAGVSRTFGRDLTIGATASYMNTEGLVLTGVTNGEYGGVNVTRRFGEFITLSGSYTAIHQTSSLPLEANALKGLSQVIGFSIAYHPRETHIIRK